MLATYHVFITFALFPAITADYFCNKSVGSNYGWIFTAYGVAGPLLAGYFKDSAQGSLQPDVWMMPFIIAGVVCLMGALIMSFAKRPGVGKKKWVKEAVVEPA
jgi:OFA family oxalate/formate antiporter-like MFS transporter